MFNAMDWFNTQVCVCFFMYYVVIYVCNVLLYIYICRLDVQEVLIRGPDKRSLYWCMHSNDLAI